MREHLFIWTLLILAGIVDRGVCSCAAWSEDRQCLLDKTVYFESGQSALNSDGKHKLAEVAKYLSTNPSSAVRIEGHCDDRGTVMHNYALGEKRAKAVLMELIRSGVDPKRLDDISCGKGRPAYKGHDPIARARNRRAELILLTPPAK